MKRAMLLILCAVVLLAGCTVGSSFTKNSVESSTDTSWTMSYEQFDGSKSMTVRLDEGETGEFFVSVMTEIGSLNLSITGADGTQYYTGNDLPTSQFTVKADKAGPYEIRFEADHHSGSFAVSWGALEKE